MRNPTPSNEHPHPYAHTHTHTNDTCACTHPQAHPYAHTQTNDTCTCTHLLTHSYAHTHLVLRVLSIVQDAVEGSVQAVCDPVVFLDKRGAGLDAVTVTVHRGEEGGRGLCVRACVFCLCVCVCVCVCVWWGDVCMRATASFQKRGCTLCIRHCNLGCA